LRYKLLSGILVLSLVASLGVNAYFYKLLVDRQAQTNNLLSQTIADWVREMDVGGYLLRNATTNVALAEVDSVFRDAQYAGNTIYASDSQTVYLYMALAPAEVAENLGPYCAGAPTQYINQTAVEMFTVLCAKIQNLTSLFDLVELTILEGANPMHLLEERGVVNSIIANCNDVRDYSGEISNFSPKFQ
jgi:hypothetical protein